MASVFGLTLPGLTETQSELVLWIAATSLVWLVIVGIVYLVRRPPDPPVGRKTLDLGPEPPAIANFLANDFRVTKQAMAATLLDLAARDIVEIEERGQDVFYIRLRRTGEIRLARYEDRVLDNVRRKASDGVIPVAALTTGQAGQSQAWWRRFAGEVIDDAKARGLSRDALDKRLFTALTALALVPAVPATLLAKGLGGGFATVVVASMILGWVRARQPQRETQQGMDAASRWLGVRAALTEDEQFRKHSPLTVELWDRLLAYGAALGVARAAAGPLAMGTESNRRAWSSYGGRWHEVRVSYPSVWPLGWGRHPLAVLAVGAAIAVPALFLLHAGLGSALATIEGPAKLFALVPWAVVVLAGVLVVRGFLDVVSPPTEMTGSIVRLRMLGDENNRRHYVAIDDGKSERIRALRVRPERYQGLSQGEVVTAKATRRLRYVSEVKDAPSS